MNSKRIKTSNMCSILFCKGCPLSVGNFHLFCEIESHHGISWIEQSWAPFCPLRIFFGKLVTIWNTNQKPSILISFQSDSLKLKQTMFTLFLPLKSRILGKETNSFLS